MSNVTLIETSKSPEKNESSQFTPKEILLPNKDQPGISKTVFSHISNLHGLLDDWSRMRDKGTRLFKAVSALKLHECNDDYYPSQLKPLMENVVEIVDSLKNIVEGVNMINNQLKALAKLQPDDSPVISTWSVKQISENVEDIYTSVQKEYKLKLLVTENVAHCRNEKLIEVYISSWELEPYFSDVSHPYLFAEVGLPGIT